MRVHAERVGHRLPRAGMGPRCGRGRDRSHGRASTGPDRRPTAGAQLVSPAARERLFDPSVAFDHPATAVLLGVVAAALAIPPIVLGLGSGFIPAAKRRDIWQRYLPWLVMV